MEIGCQQLLDFIHLCKLETLQIIKIDSSSNIIFVIFTLKKCSAITFGKVFESSIYFTIFEKNTCLHIKTKSMIRNFESKSTSALRVIICLLCNICTGN